ncbi:MAG: hypothetical protein JW727_02175 [Candidatus Aenigmarchaeota archaeon]|nr:hypothetical protein [Candidatus Aenigmarchaeota archaeon]
MSRKPTPPSDKSKIHRYDPVYGTGSESRKLDELIGKKADYLLKKYGSKLTVSQGESSIIIGLTYPREQYPSVPTPAERPTGSQYPWLPDYNPDYRDQLRAWTLSQPGQSRKKERDLFDGIITRHNGAKRNAIRIDEKTPMIFLELPLTPGGVPPKGMDLKGYVGGAIKDLSEVREQIFKLNIPPKRDRYV